MNLGNDLAFLFQSVIPTRVALGISTHINSAIVSPPEKGILMPICVPAIKLTTVAVLLTTLLGLSVLGINDPLYCQESAPTTAQSATPAKKLTLAFRLEDWYAKHFPTAQAAAEHVKVLKQLGCEVKTVQHNGHTDVQARTTLWKALALDTDDQVHQWQNWLRAAGFDTLHGYKSGDESHKHEHQEGEPHLEIVKYRLPATKSIHAHKPQDESQFQILFGSLGCTYTVQKHGNHADLQVSCPEWMEVELVSHDAAHAWQEFLKQNGFETEHAH